MNNKYQEALKTIKNSLTPKLVKDNRYKTYKAIETISELIDKYNKISNELNNLFHEIEFDNISANQLKKKIKRLYSEVMNDE